MPYTKRAVSIVREMLPEQGLAAVDLDSEAFKDICREHGYTDVSIREEVKGVLAALGRGEFSVLDT